MRLREWWNEEMPDGSEGGPDGGEPNLDEVRRRGEELMSRAGDALRKASSGEAERFMNAVRQQGGQ